MKVALLLFCVIFSIASLHSQSWQFIGPDSASWRGVVQMDVRFKQGSAPHIGVATSKGVAAHLGTAWGYVLPDFAGHPVANDVYYRSVYFSPWNDSVAFIGEDLIEPGIGKPGSGGGTVRNIHSNYWGVAQYYGGGWIGHSPSLSSAFSPHQWGKAYSWLVSLYRTPNNGIGWQSLLFSFSYGSWFLAPDQRKDSILYAGIRPGQRGIYRSTDDGLTWSLVRLFAFPSTYPHPYSDFHASGDTLLHTSSRFPQVADSTCGIFVSTDYGVTWIQVVRNINVQKLTRDARKPNEFFAAARGGIYRSTTSGLTWQIYIDSLPSLKLVDI